MKLTYSKKIFIISAIVLVGILLLDTIFTNLLFDKIIGVNEKVKQLTLSAEERERSIALSDSIAGSETERVKLSQYFIGATDAQTANFISQIEALAKNAGLVYSVKSVDYQPVSDLGASGAVTFIHLKLNVTGKWNNVFGFLQTIENLPKVVLVQGVSLSTNSQSKAWSADIDFSVVKLKNL